MGREAKTDGKKIEETLKGHFLVRECLYLKVYHDYLVLTNLFVYPIISELLEKPTITRGEHPKPTQEGSAGLKLLASLKYLQNSVKSDDAKSSQLLLSSPNLPEMHVIILRGL